METDTGKTEPASRRLAAQLRAAIESGQLAPGDRLPSERKLVETHDVARNTAREAVRLLADEGLVTVEHGRGAFVRVKPKLMRFGSSRYLQALRERTGLSPYRAEVEAQGSVPRVACTSIEELPAPEFVSDRLGLAAGTHVVRRENHYFADDEAVQIGVTYIPTPIAQGTPLANSAKLGPGSLYARFAEKGHDVVTIREEISARMLTHDEIQQLGLPGGVPIIDVVHTSIDQNSQPFEVTTFAMRADVSGLDYTMPVEE